MQAWLAFSDRDGTHRAWHGIIAFLNIVVGVWLIANPLPGTLSLAAVLGVLFLIMGALRIFIGLQMTSSQMKGMLILSGAASVLLGVIVFSDFQNAASALLGLLLGIQLLIDGIGLIALGFASRNS